MRYGTADGCCCCRIPSVELDTRSAGMKDVFENPGNQDSLVSSLYQNNCF